MYLWQENILQFLIENFVNEAIIDKMKEKYPAVTQEIEFFRDVPQKYIQWISKQIDSFEKQFSGREKLDQDDLMQIKNAILKFDKLALKNLISPKDIFAYTSVPELERALEDAEKKSEATSSVMRQQAKANSKLIYKDEKYVIIQPLNTEASCYYGYGTKWCISGKEQNQFSNYSSKGAEFIFIISRQAKDQTYNKIALAFNRKVPGRLEIFDAQDNKITKKQLSSLVPENILNIISTTIGFSVLELKPENIKKTLEAANGQELIDAISEFYSEFNVGPDSAKKVLEFIKTTIIPIIPVSKLYALVNLKYFDAETESYEIFRPDTELLKMGAQKLKENNVSIEEILRQYKLAEQLFGSLDPANNFYTEYLKEKEISNEELNDLSKYQKSLDPDKQYGDYMFVGSLFSNAKTKKVLDFLGLRTNLAQKILLKLGHAISTYEKFIFFMEQLEEKNYQKEEFDKRFREFIGYVFPAEISYGSRLKNDEIKEIVKIYESLKNNLIERKNGWIDISNKAHASLQEIKQKLKNLR